MRLFNKISRALLINIICITVGLSQGVIYIDLHEKQLRTQAEDLAEKLQESSGKNFKIAEVSQAEHGIWLTINKKNLPNEIRHMSSEAFYIKSSPNYVLLGGNSILAVQHAIYEYLEQLGFRYYYPHPDWHIIPKTNNIFPSFEKLTEPIYEHRRIWYASGTDSKEADKNYKNWVKYNKLGGAFQVNTGHTYQSIINRNKEEFRQHPEYFALKENGERESSTNVNAKFCFSNPGLIEICKKDVLAQFAKAERTGKPLQMASMDPSDGWNTCHCANCKRLGSTSDRVFYLANEVAKAVKKKYPDKWIGLYAYANHAEPTSIKLEDNVFVMVATAFNKTSLTTEELIKKWSKIVSKIGIRDYYGVLAWDFDMPGRVKGGNVRRISEEIPKYASMGAFAMSAETNIGWISRGLGQYIAGKLLWSTNVQIEKIKEDFFEKAFGKAKNPMRRLHVFWSENPDPVPSDHNLAKWLKLVREAYDMADNESTKKRVLHYMYYLHYVVLYKEYKENPDPKHHLYTELLNYVWRIKELEVCAGFPIIRRLAGGRAPSKEYNYRNPNCVWKRNSAQITRKNLIELFENDLKRYKEIKGIEETTYSNELSRVVNPNLKSFYGNLYRGGHTVFVNASSPSLLISMGYVSSQKIGTASVYRIDHSGAETFVNEKKINSDKKFYELLDPVAGTYKVVITDNKAGFMLKSANQSSISLSASTKSKTNSSRRNNFYFFVPENTTKFFVQKKGPITFKSPIGRIVKYENNKTEGIEIIVKPKETGIWQIINQSGSFYFMGIPPVVTISSHALLIPETIE